MDVFVSGCCFFTTGFVASNTIWLPACAFANSLDTDQGWQYDGPNRLTLLDWWFWVNYFKTLIFEKKTLADDKKDHEKISLHAMS